MLLRALIWDVDGTLADTERDAHRPAFNAAFAELGLDWEWDEQLYGELLKVAGGVERMRHYARTVRHVDLPELELEELLRQLHARKTVLYVRTVASGAVPLRPGIEHLLRQAHVAGLHQAIATTTTRDNVDALLLSCLGPGAIDRFRVIATAREASAKKPDPAVYTYALSALGLHSSEVLAIEDSRNGLLAAHAAGIGCVVTRNAYTARDDFTGAVAVLDDLRLTQLSDLVKWHQARLDAAIRR